MINPNLFTALEGVKQTLKDETSGILLRERLPSVSGAKEEKFDLGNTKLFLNPPPRVQRHFVDCLAEHVPSTR